MPESERTFPADTPANRRRQRMAGYRDAMIGRAFGTSGSYGGHPEELKAAYKKGWALGRDTKHGYEVGQEVVDTTAEGRGRGLVVRFHLSQDQDDPEIWQRVYEVDFDGEKVERRMGGLSDNLNLAPATPGL